MEMGIHGHIALIQQGYKNEGVEWKPFLCFKQFEPQEELAKEYEDMGEG